MTSLAGTDEFAVPFAPSSARQRLAERLRRSYQTEEYEGLRLAALGRAAALVVIALLLLYLTPMPDVLYYYGLLVLFFLIGYAYVLIARLGVAAGWLTYALTAVDFGLLGFTLLYPNPLATVEFPPQFALRFGNFIYFYVMLAGVAFSYRPLLMIWGGAAGALAWGIGVALLAGLPDTVLDVPPNATGEEIVAAVLRPTFVDLGVRTQEIVVFLIVAGLLSVIVWRSRRLVLRQAMLERERSNLARYFSPATVERLAGQDTPLGQVREQNAAILFADLVGFTSWAEGRQPSEVIGLLRDVHARLEQAVFEHHGTFDKFIGDGAMATFGTPDPGPADARNALACARTMLGSFEAWNAARRRQGLDEVRIGIGVHYGPVVVGDVGTERRLELAVLGDTVNVASRLERLTRELGCRAVVSDALVEAARSGAGDAESLLAGFRPSGEASVRGRSHDVPVWTDAQAAMGETGDAGR